MWTFEAPVWVAEGTGAWHFVSVPAASSDEIRARVDTARPGFGAVAVEATLGRTTWRTSIFPDSRRGAYVLPLKRPVRKAEGFGEGDVVSVAIALAE